MGTFDECIFMYNLYTYIIGCIYIQQIYSIYRIFRTYKMYHIQNIYFIHVLYTIWIVYNTSCKFFVGTYHFNNIDYLNLKLLYFHFDRNEILALSNICFSRKKSALYIWLQSTVEKLSAGIEQKSVVWLRLEFLFYYQRRNDRTNASIVQSFWNIYIQRIKR